MHSGNDPFSSFNILIKFLLTRSSDVPCQRRSHHNGKYDGVLDVQDVVPEGNHGTDCSHHRVKNDLIQGRTGDEKKYLDERQNLVDSVQNKEKVPSFGQKLFPLGSCSRTEPPVLDVNLDWEAIHRTETSKANKNILTFL